MLFLNFLHNIWQHGRPWMRECSPHTLVFWQTGKKYLDAAKRASDAGASKMFVNAGQRDAKMGKASSHMLSGCRSSAIASFSPVRNATLPTLAQIYKLHAYFDDDFSFRRRAYARCRWLAQPAVDSNSLAFIIIARWRHRDVNTFITLDTREHDVFIVMQSNNNNKRMRCAMTLIHIVFE